ncbi:zinc finger CCCH domain-containing protein 18-like [Daphnia pulicaria]|uniref:zinc finger CCCH domain-containing protein 18-like n=1 Tax=Daphnia pulicaria TaxID=35523 RepID=UPI001EE9FB59|nr:zinc finger CCCH domain-containing protein 18-like [Daphnia pulicaria]XP_046639047.1 zinc finger CCCH domain-containing protein 18-like [Daphnia pulicaria]
MVNEDRKDVCDDRDCHNKEREGDRERERDNKDRERDKDYNKDCDRVNDQDNKELVRDRDRERRERERMKSRSRSRSRDRTTRRRRSRSQSPRDHHDRKDVKTEQDAKDQEASEENNEQQAIKKEPLSLEELLAKKKAEEEEKSKPKFLAKEEHAAEAMRKQQEQVENQRKQQEEERSKRNAFFQADEETNRDIYEVYKHPIATGPQQQRPTAGQSAYTASEVAPQQQQQQQQYVTPASGIQPGMTVQHLPPQQPAHPVAAQIPVMAQQNLIPLPRYRTCYGCGKPGHEAKDCPNPNGARRTSYAPYGALYGRHNTAPLRRHSTAIGAPVPTSIQPSTSVMTQSNSMHPVVLLPTSALFQQQSQPTRWLDGQSAYTASEVAPQQQQYVTPASGIQPGMTRGGAGGGRGGGGRPCFNCNEEGHMSRECPKPSTRGGGRGGGRGGSTATCYNCNEDGHMSRECPEPSTRGRGGGRGGGSGGGRNTCFKCNEEGHMSRDCPNGGSSGGGSRSRSSIAPADDDWGTSYATSSSSPWATGANAAPRGRSTPSASKSNDDDWGASTTAPGTTPRSGDGRRSSRPGGRSPRQIEMGDATPLNDE